MATHSSVLAWRIPMDCIVHAVFDDGHSDWCEVIPHCSFGLHFSSN